MAKKNTETLIQEKENPSLPEYRYQDKVALFRRDKWGLLENLEYHFKDDGSINWKKLVPINDFVPNRERYPKNTDFKSLNIAEQPDEKLLILLNGFKSLARIRGVKSVEYTIGESSSPVYCSIGCKITWMGNYETNMLETVSSGVADAHFNNIKSDNFARYYISSTAQNRAFVRAVKDGTGITIYGFDEIGETPADNKGLSLLNPSGPHAALEKRLQSKNRSFEQLKDHLIKEKVSFINLEKLNSYESVSQFTNEEAVRVMGWIAEKNKIKTE